MNLIKMQIPTGCGFGVMLFASSVGLATIGVCIFCAAYFGSRTFYFIKEKKMKKALTILLLVLAIVFALSACQSDDTTDTGNNTTDTGSSDSGNSGTGNGDTGSGDSGNSGTGSGDTGSGGSGNSGTGSGDTGSGDSGNSGTGSGDTGSGGSGNSGTGNGDTGSGDSGNSGTGSGDTGSGGSGNSGTGSGDTGSGNSGNSGTGNGDTGNTDMGGSTDQKTTYTIVWVDENGNTLKSMSVDEGETPSYTYTVTDTAEWDRTFVGWSSAKGGEILSSIPAATANTTYYANVTEVKQTYTVTFNSMGGSTVLPQTVEYGAKATLPEAPTYEAHKFVGWSYSATEVNRVDFEQGIVGNVEYFAVWNEVVNVKELLVSLLNGYSLNPYSFIPETMRFNYSDNLVNSADIVSDYSSFVDVADINYGFGEQWHMVLDNLEQSKTFFNVLSVVDTLATASITSFNNYFDKNPDDTAHHEFASGIYNVSIDFDGENITYVLDYTAELPIVGVETAQIALSMDIATGERYVRIQLGDANALTYTMLEDSYSFAIKYAGVRRAMFSIARDDNGNVNGKIYEYLTVSSVEIASAADFYITDEYVSVVGNKASGMLGFTGYISELYNTDNGKLLGYEVQETLSSIVYNTLWFNLSDIGGIDTIKYQAATEDTEAMIFINGESDKWETKKVGGIGLKMLSRRFDIEYRTQYVYSYDATNETYVEHKVDVPMLFVQEENYDTFVSDVEATNNVDVSVNVKKADLDQMLAYYDALIPVFISNKDLITPDVIIAFIGEKIVFQ